MAMLMRNESLSDDNLQQVTISFCNHMWAVCDMVTKAHTPSEARAFIRLINVAKELFSLGLVVHTCGMPASRAIFGAAWPPNGHSVRVYHLGL